MIKHMARVTEKSNNKFGNEYEVKAFKFGGIIVIVNIDDDKNETHDFVGHGEFELFDKEF